MVAKLALLPNEFHPRFLEAFGPKVKVPEALYAHRKAYQFELNYAFFWLELGNIHSSVNREKAIYYAESMHYLTLINPSTEGLDEVEVQALFQRVFDKLVAKDLQLKKDTLLSGLKHIENKKQSNIYCFFAASAANAVVPIHPLGDIQLVDRIFDFITPQENKELKHLIALLDNNSIQKMLADNPATKDAAVLVKDFCSRKLEELTDTEKHTLSMV